VVAESGIEPRARMRADFLKIGGSILFVF